VQRKEKREAERKIQSYSKIEAARERGEWHLMPLIEGRGKILGIFFVETQAALDVLHLTSSLICQFAKQS
jgi:hypothetical protein